MFKVAFSAIMAVVIAVFAWIAVNAWLAHTTKSGTVMEREFHPAHTDYTTQCTGNPSVCTTVPQHYPDRWSLRIERSGWDAWVGVDEYTYRACKPGDYWDSQNLEGCGS